MVILGEPHGRIGEWSDVVERSARVLGLVCTVMCVSVSLLAALGPGLAASHLFWAAAASLLALAATVAVFQRGFTMVTAFGAGAATLILIWFAPAADGELVVLLPVFLVYVALGIRGRLGIAVSVALACAFAVHERMVDPRLGPAELITSTAGRIATMVAGVVLVAHLRRAARENDQLARANRAADRVADQHAARQRQADWVDHYLHDGVVHALKAISLGERLTRAEARSAARAAASDLERLTVGTDDSRHSLRDELQRLAESSGLRVRVAAQRVSVPAYVRPALIDATREALRNVRLHSGTDAAVLELRRVDATGVVVRISDSGPGFDPTNDLTGHFGVRNGISARMTQVGGSAEVNSDARGTVVTLRWQSDLQPGWWRARLQTRHTVVAVGSPFVALSVLQCALMAHRTARPWLAVLGTAILAAVWVACCVGLRDGQVSWREAALIRVAAVVASLCGGLALPSQPRDPQLFWLAGGAAALLLFGAFTRPLRESAVGGLVLAVLPTALAILRGADAADLVALAPATATAAIAVGMVFIAAELGRRLARDADGYERLAGRRERQVAELGVREEILRDRVANLKEEILPFLAAVASDEVDCRDAQVVAMAGVYEARVRDGLGGDLTAWPEALTMRVDELRRGAWSVSLARHAPLDADSVAQIDAALEAVTTGAGSPGRILVRSTPSPTGSRLTVSLSPFDPEVAGAWMRLRGHLLTDERTFLLLELTKAVGPVEPAQPARPEFPGHARRLQIATMES